MTPEELLAIDPWGPEAPPTDAELLARLEECQFTDMIESLAIMAELNARGHDLSGRA